MNERPMESSDSRLLRIEGVIVGKKLSKTLSNILIGVRKPQHDINVIVFYFLKLRSRQFDLLSLPFVYVSLCVGTLLHRRRRTKYMLKAQRGVSKPQRNYG